MPLHHRHVVREHLIRRAKPQAVLDVVVGFLLVDRQLPAAILQAEHPQMVVEALLVDAVLAFHLAVVTLRRDTDAVVEDVVFLQLSFKQALVIRIVGDQRLGELRAVVRLNLTNRERIVVLLGQPSDLSYLLRRMRSRRTVRSSASLHQALPRPVIPLQPLVQRLSADLKPYRCFRPVPVFQVILHILLTCVRFLCYPVHAESLP